MCQVRVSVSSGERASTSVATGKSSMRIPFVFPVTSTSTKLEASGRTRESPSRNGSSASMLRIRYRPVRIEVNWKCPSRPALAKRPDRLSAAPDSGSIRHAMSVAGAGRPSGPMTVPSMVTPGWSRISTSAASPGRIQIGRRTRS